MKQSTLKKAVFIILIPVLYAMLLRVIFNLDVISNFATVMSITFFISVPFGAGIITISLSPLEKVKRWLYRIFMPWVPIGFFFLLTLLLKMEGWACWLMILPIFLLFASAGGLIAGYFKIKKSQQEKTLNSSIVLTLPLVLLSFENMVPVLPARYEAYTFLDIHANAEKIWNNVVRVSTIKTDEDKSVITRLLGFPRPISAELDYMGVGGSRKAVFSGGLVFDETVTAYAPRKMMQFSIKANPYAIPSATMDKHVVIGGDYFDVLDGSYRMQRINDSTLRLHLYSHFELKTSFNFYAGWWAALIMKDIQNNVLQVIKKRCEPE